MKEMKFTKIYYASLIGLITIVPTACIMLDPATNPDRPYENHYPYPQIQAKCPPHARTREQQRACEFTVRQRQIEYFDYVQKDPKLSERQKTGCVATPAENTLKSIYKDAVACTKSMRDNSKSDDKIMTTSSSVRETMQELLRAANNNMHVLKL